MTLPSTEKAGYTEDTSCLICYETIIFNIVYRLLTYIPLVINGVLHGWSVACLILCNAQYLMSTS